MSYSVSSPTGAGTSKTNGSTTPGLGDEMTPEEEIDSLKAQLADERARRSRLNESMLLIRQKVSGEVQRLELQSTQLNATVEKLTTDVADRDATISLLKEENEVNNALLKRGEERLAEVTREMEHAIFQRDCSTGDIDELNSQVAELQGQVEDLQEQDKTKEKTISKLKAELTEQTNLVGTLKSQLATAQKTIEDLRSSSSASAPPDALVKLRSSYEGALSEMSGVMASVRREQDVLRDERESLRRELENVKKDADNLRRENKSLNDEKRIEGARYQALLTEANDRLAEQRRGLRREEQTLQSSLSSARTEAETYKSQVATLRGELESTKSQFTSVRGESESLRMQLMSSKSEGEAARAQLSGTRSELESLRIQLATARAEVEAYRVQLEPSRVREAEWKRDAETSKAALSALESEILALKEEAAREVGTLREKVKAFEAAAASPRDIVELKAALASREMALNNVRRELEGSQRAHAQVVEKHGDPSAEISLARLVAHLREENERLKGEVEAVKRQLEEARAAHKSAEDDLGKATEYGRALLASNRDLQLQLKEARLSPAGEGPGSPTGFTHVVDKLTVQMERMCASMERHASLLRDSERVRDGREGREEGVKPSLPTAQPIPAPTPAAPPNARIRDMAAELSRERERRLDVESEVRALQQALAVLSTQPPPPKPPVLPIAPTPAPSRAVPVVTSASSMLFRAPGSGRPPSPTAASASRRIGTPHPGSYTYSRTAGAT